MELAFNNLIAQGYQVRAARMDDLPQVVPMFNAAEIEAVGAGEWTVERYEDEWRQNGLDLDNCTRIVFSPDGQVVGLIELWDNREPPVHPWIWAQVHPVWKGHGIGTAMMEWALETSRRVLDRLPEGVRMAPIAAASSKNQPTIALFEGLGMSVVRYSWRMLRSLEGEIPEPKWPEGIRVRNLRYPDDAEAVFRAEDEAFSAHWGYIKPDFEIAFPRWKAYNFDAVKLDPALWFLAMDGEVIAGSINAQERSDQEAGVGYIPDLFVSKPYRKQGVGQALLYQAFHALQERGVKQVTLGVDAKNSTGATRLYQRVGMHADREIMQFEKELRAGKELAVVD